ncbi:MAG: phosphate transport system permease protein [Planctomycetota bacterium]|jgi:phosphate transport system permease protein
MKESQPTSKTRRIRKTRRSVIYVEHLARAAITAGGIGTIIAVGLIFVFLVWVVLPLFESPELQSDERIDVPALAEAPFHMGTDDERLMAWILHRDGGLELIELGSGRPITVLRPFGDAVPTAASFSAGTSDGVFGFADGTVRIGEIAFDTTFLKDGEVAAELSRLHAGEQAIYEEGIILRTSMGQLSRTAVRVELQDPLPTSDSSPIAMIDHAITPAGLSLLTLQENGALRVARVRSKRNLMSGKVTRSLKTAELEAARTDGKQTRPFGVKIGGLGQHAYVVGEDGQTQHWDLRKFDGPRLFEELDLVEKAGVRVTALAFATGRKTLLVGDSSGMVARWFPAQEEGSSNDPLLVYANPLLQGDSPARIIAASPRSRMVAVGFESGTVELLQATLRDRLLTLHCDELALALIVSPKEDAILARTATKIAAWEIDTKYPSASLTALFTPVWYEGYQAPKHFWQSSSADDDFEPKLGLMPLVFGTIKATIYSMIFGAPLALLAAIYTSEFMAKRFRSTVKSTVELMASLPSVVLGFIAALVIAPFVQSAVPMILAAMLVIPATTLLGAHLWLLLPGHISVRWQGWQRFLAISMTLPVGFLITVMMGPTVERVFFAGDITAWLAGQTGSGWGGWFFLLLPLASLVTLLLSTMVLGPMLKARSREWDRKQSARAQGAKFLLGLVLTIALAAGIALLLQTTGLDPRGGVVGTYVQRNALIVGFVMGFAIVPIIYTLAEDSLSEVPTVLREGSLGAGATQWQTTVRIVVPFAMSGIFSAMMIGLGRAVGETMIVLMAAGNTPVMDWNIFNGFRTLSANIAVELPEAVAGSDHYRTLFLAALVLFAMTFLLNTLAELVRRHFRNRFKAL